MTYPLNSPGSSVTVTDESNYATAGEGTVPLIIIGTHEYKSLPSGSGVAEGTLPENANKLYPITSQRELLQTFGNPIFYTKNGSAVHGYELNEFGLHAAYQYLGIANRAFVIRADIDYAQLIPKQTEPRSEAAHGTNWLDTQNNTWGIYEYTGSEWAERDLWIVESTDELDTEAAEIITGQKVPLLADSLDNDFAMVVVYQAKTLYQKIKAPDVDAAWYVVGTEDWKDAKVLAGGNADLSLKYNTYRPEDGETGDVLVLHTPDVVNSISSAATWTLKSFNINTGVWEETLVPIYSSAKESTLAQTDGAVYLQFNSAQAQFTFRKYNGSNWVNLGEVAQAAEPTRPADDGTLWYNNLNIVANIKVNDGGTWVPYRTYYPATDANGVILLGSQPTAQSSGAPLVNRDLWIDTSDLENFPKMYRYHNGVWVAVDVENNIDPINGIAFGEEASTSAINYAEGMMLFDLAASTNDVKKYDATTGLWTNVSGFQPNGVPYFGRKAQRHMIMVALAATISANEDIRAETVHFNLLAALATLS
jgi:hypothetical protein